MNFFEQQEKARKRTSRLIFFYGVAVVLIIVAIYVISLCIFKGVLSPKNGEVINIGVFWNPELLLMVSVVVGAIVLLGTVYKIYELSRGGGAAVAEMLGGRLLAPNSTDFLERRILNVVEEMALASGIPVPRVYLLDKEESVNAFAAGLKPSDAVIGVTRGCVQKLTRDELQGVIAHEFSHVFNGDMRLNLRLMGVLNGILVIALIGYWIFRIAANSSQGQSRSRDRKGGGAMAFVLFGLAVIVIGYIGVFFAKLIKSAVSRQREFLADASSVQYTRNPSGIAGALKKIGGWASGSTLQSSKAEEASHFFFANGLKYTFFNLMATHPPLDERIRRIDPQFDGVFPPVHEGAEGAGMASEMAAQPRASFSVPSVPPSVPTAGGSVPLMSQAVSHQVGAPQREHLQYAIALLANLPDDLKSMAREPQSAQALILALLLNREGPARAQQLSYIAEHVDPVIHETFNKILPSMGDVGPESRLPLADLCLAALRHLSGPQYESLRNHVMFMTSADQEIDLFEYAVLRMLVRNLDPLFRKVKRPVIQYYDLKSVLSAAQELLAALAWAGSDDAASATAAFQRGLSCLGMPKSVSAVELHPQAQVVLQNLDHALDKLALTSMPLRKRLLDACAACIAQDGRVTVEEGELFRAIADSLDCPMPPLLNQAA